MPDPLYRKIYEKFQLTAAIHMTDINNLETIVKEGLRSHNRMQGRKYVNISNDDVQAGRSTKTIDVSGRLLHDYVPLYFGFKTPMVACNQHRNEDLIFLRFSLSILETPGLVFSDGNAYSRDTKFFRFVNIDSLEVLDVKGIHTVKYANDNEKRRRKQAEILVPDFIPFDQVLDIFVYSKTAEERVLAILLQYGKKLSVSIQPGWYFQTR